MPLSLDSNDDSTLCDALSSPPERLYERATPETPDGRFVHQRPIGQGGLATRYRAFDRDRGIEVEIEILTGDDQARWVWAEMYKFEAARTQELGHPGIVPILDVIEEAGRLTVVRPLLPERFTPPGPLDPAEAARMVAELAEIVENVHVHGKLLRGLAFDEIRVSPDGHVFLEGCAVHAGGDHQAAGSLALIAPERLTSASRRRMSADVYSLGALLYRWLTGRTVLDDKSGKTPSLRESVALLNSGRWTPTPPRRINRKIPAALEAICLRAISLEPEQRPVSAGALAAELRAFVTASKPKPADRRKGLWK
jgi:serine/threonine protein kinase